MNLTVKKIIWLTLFSIAMGYMETAVVVYLRKLYYPDGFRFPLIPVEPAIAVTEFLREAATIIMLAGIGILSGKTRTEKFAFFIYCFAVWDIFYYVFLKVLLGWPESFFTWDILFLIPVPWVGPVLAPLIVSFTMIFISGMIVHFEEKKANTIFAFRENLMMICGCIVIIFSFMMDYIIYACSASSSAGLWNITSERSLFEEVENYIPVRYNWALFWAGEALLLFSALIYFLRMKKQTDILK